MLRYIGFKIIPCSSGINIDIFSAPVHLYDKDQYGTYYH